MDSIYELSGGQPFLVQQMALLIDDSSSAAAAVHRARADRSHFDFHLRHLEQLVRASPAASAAIAKLLAGKPLTRTEGEDLDRIGIVQQVAEQYKFLNRLYQDYFKRMASEEAHNTTWSARLLRRLRGAS